MAALKAILITVIIGILWSDGVSSQQLPSVYEYFTTGGITSGLVAENKKFILNGKEIRIISGGMHYFRIHPSLWRDRLRKLRALGANSVETYVSWNLHEPQKDVFDFGNGTNDFSAFMDIRKFVQIAQEEDLLLILRPGPYICAEWDWGGFPSWLATGSQMKVRENYQPYLDRVKIFLDRFLSELVDLKFTTGGSIIALQIENEYSSFGPTRSREYLEFIRQVFLDNSYDDTLLFTADNSGWTEFRGGIPGVLQTANTHDPDGSFTQLIEVQPDKPLMAMEYYSGWFNHWFDDRKGTRNPQDFFTNLDKIFGKYNGSVNFYMFHGGTNFGFMAGANGDGEPPYQLYDITSYDYDALISEAGDYHENYQTAVDMIAMYENPKLRKPNPPPASAKAAYTNLVFKEHLTYSDIIERIPSSQKVRMDRAVSMENLPINNGNGQSYGYIIYRIAGNFSLNDTLRVSWPRDLAQLIIDGEQIQTGYQKQQPEYWINSIKEFPLQLSTSENHTLDVMVENMGRIGFGQDHEFVQEKGIASIHQAKLEINNQEVQGLEIIAAEFTNSWAKNLTGWRTNEDSMTLKAPVLLRATFNIDGQPFDTFLDMRGWHKGVVFVNGFNIGRYFRVGPQETLYVPAPLLNTGLNTVLVFEQLETQSYIAFRTSPLLG